MEGQVPKIEGISPDMLWTFMVVLVGLAALFVLGHKVIEIVRKEQERKREKQQLEGQDITDKIADKVMAKLQTKLDEKFEEFDKHFEDIDKALTADRETIEMHTRQLNAQEERVNRLDGNSKALCHGVFALLSHEINGNSIDKLTKAHDAMKNYLIDGVYKEDDWK